MRRLHWLILAFVLVLVASSTVAPATPQTTGFMASRVADKAFEESVKARVNTRRAECMSAIGSSTFCNCVAGDLPLGVDFHKYIAITTSSVSKLFFDQLSPDDQRIAPRILSTRDRCVATAFGAPP